MWRTLNNKHLLMRGRALASALPGSPAAAPRAGAAAQEPRGGHGSRCRRVGARNGRCRCWRCSLKTRMSSWRSRPRDRCTPALALRLDAVCISANLHAQYLQISQILFASFDLDCLRSDQPQAQLQRSLANHQQKWEAHAALDRFG